MKKEKDSKLTKKLINKELNKGSYFILEKNLLYTPLDWIECIMFIKYSGIVENPPFIRKWA